jgi:hypothetical protein
MACKSFVILRPLSLWIALFMGVSVATVAGAAPAGACDTEAYREFDFWLGRWEVHLEDGRKAGRNRITRTGDGCLIEEHWIGVNGGEGRSMNFHDPSSGRWRQVWVSGDSLIDIAGGLEAGEMILEGDIRYRASGEVLPFRGRWRVLEDGRVRQFFEELRGDTWEPWFEGFYSKAVE